MSRGFLHSKWRQIRPELPAVRSVADIAADPVLYDQILSTIDPPIDFAGLCRDINPAAFASLAARCVPEPPGLERTPASSYPGLSEKAASIIYYCLRLRKLAPGLRQGPVVEIGGGLGLLAKVLLTAGVASEYHIVDLPEMIAVQRTFFAEANVDVSRIRFHDVLELDAGRPPAPELRTGQWSLAVSTFGLSEATPSFQDWAAATLFANAAAVYLVGHTTFHGHPVRSHLESLLTLRFAVTSSPFVYTGHGIDSFELFGAAGEPTIPTTAAEADSDA